MEKLQDLSFQTNVLENTSVHRCNRQELTGHHMMQVNESFSKYLYKQVSLRNIPVVSMKG